jgi:hypothetical protein
MSAEQDDEEHALPIVDEDTVSTGAAADSSQPDEPLKSLPRILRCAMLFGTDDAFVRQRLIAEIDELSPRLPLNAAWAQTADIGTGVALAIELDHRAVVQDQPALRSIADCVRLLTLPMPVDHTHIDDHRRVAKALLQALNKLSPDTEGDLLAQLEEFCFGWAALPVGTDLLPRTRAYPAAASAARLGSIMAVHRVAAAEQALRELIQDQEEQRQNRQAESAKVGQASSGNEDVSAVPDGHLVVARLHDDQLRNGKLKDIVAPLKAIINTALPLVPVPILHPIRQQLLFEFPYAQSVIDFALADLVGRTTIALRPLLLCGGVGAGKSRFARRLGQLLGLHVWRTDASHSDGAAFSGTDRRWSSAEPCHPLLAVSHGKHANPLVLLDELDKAGTRSDYGRLWDCLLGFLEPETNSRYPDPALQTDLDLSMVSYIATANSLEPLPGPIRDRFRTITFPKPTKDDLQALLPAVLADLARERGLDRRWIAPLDEIERVAVANYWNGGSVRQLRRFVEAILRERDANSVRN